MGTIEWTEDLKVGIDLVDDQHKLLIQHLSDFSIALGSGKEAGEILKTLGFLIDYTDFHFSAEVRYMEELGYPGRPHHVKQHEEFTSTLGNLVEDFEEEGITKALADSIDTFLWNWLSNHIKTVDVEFGKFLINDSIAL